MNDLKTVLANIPFIPEWTRIVALNLLGIYIILQLVCLILKKLQKQELRNAMSALKNLSGEALRRAGRSLELPIERPKLALVSLALNTVLFYVIALIFFAWFGVFLMLSATTENIVLFKRLLAFGIAGAFVIGSRWYYASAERERIALTERWKAMKIER